MSVTYYLYYINSNVTINKMRQFVMTKNKTKRRCKRRASNDGKCMQHYNSLVHKCCFCDQECNPCSQTCGRCARTIMAVVLE